MNIADRARNAIDAARYRHLVDGVAQIVEALESARGDSAVSVFAHQQAATLRALLEEAT